MKLNLNVAIKDLNDEAIPETNLGKFIASQLSQSNKGDALKLFEWALKLNKGEEIDIDSSDQELLKGFVNTSETMTNIVKYRFLECLKDKKSK
jgi:hypothetical protein